MALVKSSALYREESDIWDGPLCMCVEGVKTDSVTSALRVGEQVQGVSVLIYQINNNHETKCTDMKAESITPEERTKGSDTYWEDNQGGDGVQVSVMRRW